jgi:tetratricopeptide (TPR) repeat protein
VVTALADTAQTGALLITSRYRLPGPDLFLAEVPVPALSPAELRRMFLRLPALAELDPADQRLLTRTIGGHPRLIEFTDALLRGGRASLRHIQSRLRDLARDHGIDLRGDRPVGQAIDQAMLLGSADILLTELLALLTSRQAAILAQVAVCRAPMTLEDLAFTFSPSPGPADVDLTAAEIPPTLAELRADTIRLADLTLLEPGPDIAMHPWTAALASRNTAADTAALHQRALAMRLRRFEQHRGGYDDLLDIPRHLATLHRYDDIVGIAEQAVRILPGTLTTVAYLSEVRPLIPAAQQAWIPVADLEAQTLLRAGNLPAATRQLKAIHHQVQARVATDPASTKWQRSLAVSHERLGEVAADAGDLGAARDHYQAALDTWTKLIATDPANTQWQRAPIFSRGNLGEVAAAAGDLGAARDHYQAALAIAERLAAADPANTEWQRDLSVSRNKLGDVAAAAGDLGAARDHYQAALAIRAKLAAADPANTGWQRDLSVSRDKLGDAAAAAGDLGAARGHYQAALAIAERLAAADPANTQWQRDLSFVRQRIADLEANASET